MDGCGKSDQVHSGVSANFAGASLADRAVCVAAVSNQADAQGPGTICGDIARGEAQGELWVGCVAAQLRHKTCCPQPHVQRAVTPRRNKRLIGRHKTSATPGSSPVPCTPSGSSCQKLPRDARRGGGPLPTGGPPPPAPLPPRGLTEIGICSIWWLSVLLRACRIAVLSIL